MTDSTPLSIIGCVTPNTIGIITDRNTIMNTSSINQDYIQNKAGLTSFTDINTINQKTQPGSSI